MANNNQNEQIKQLVAIGSQYLKNQFTADNIQPAKKHRVVKPPAYQEKHIIEHVSGDLRRYLQVRYFIHKPSLEFPEISHFLSFIGKYSMYVKIQPDELANLISFLQKIYNDTVEFDEKHNSLVPVMEKQRELNDKFEAAVLAGNVDQEVDD